MHLHDLLGDGEAEAGPALGLGIGTIHLVELIQKFSRHAVVLAGLSVYQYRKADA